VARLVSSPIAVYTGPFGPREAERLLWRAGFGPRPGQAKRLARLGMRKAVRSLTRVAGPAPLRGPEPHDGEGNPLAPFDLWGHDHLWWLDRMVRSEHPLVERMTLIWHDWFATSDDDVDSSRLMLQQNELFRRGALGSFHELLRQVTVDPAMLVWLDGIKNRRRFLNENYAREMMELFTLGANRGAYTETDVREMARALSGWRASWVDEVGYTDFRFDPARFDSGTKTIFGQTGGFGWEDACRLCVQHPLHPSFAVSKLWSYFAAAPPPAHEQRALEQTYVASGYAIRPLVEAILMHPLLYKGPSLVKPPVLFLAGMLRALGRGIDTEDWVWLCSLAGQRLFQPPNVAGWDDARWLDTSTIRARWQLVAYAHEPRALGDERIERYSATETAERALEKALTFWGEPSLTKQTRKALLRFAAGCVRGPLDEWEESAYRGLRQNALRHLIYAAPDMQRS
jgi:uncharacterized protein (DUF1800 family)